MTIEQERNEAIAFMDTYCNKYIRSAAMWAFAKEQGLDKATIVLPYGKEHSALSYAQQLMTASCRIGNPTEAEDIESYFIVSLMVALEDSRRTDWSYGSYLNYQMKTSPLIRNSQNQVYSNILNTVKGEAQKNGTQPALSPAQIKNMIMGRVHWEKEAFYACHNNACGTDGIAEVLNNNILAAAMYCARMQTLHYTLPGYTKGFSSPNEGEMVSVLDGPKEDTRATLAYLARTYIPHLIPENGGEVVERALKWLFKRGFFEAQAISTAGFAPATVTLAQHTVDVIYRAAELLLPATPAQIGEIVMAGLCHDLADLIPPENRSWGHGYTSLDLALELFGSNIPLSVASAIDGCTFDTGSNINAGVQIETQPLTLFLHIANTIASFIDEAYVEDNSEGGSQ